MDEKLRKSLFEGLVVFFYSCDLVEVADSIRKHCSENVPSVPERSKAALLTTRKAIDAFIELQVNNNYDVTTADATKTSQVVLLPQLQSSVSSSTLHSSIRLSHTGAVPLTEVARKIATPVSDGKQVLSRTQTRSSPSDEPGISLNQLLEIQAQNDLFRGLDTACLQQYLDRSRADEKDHGFYIGQWRVHPDTPLNVTQVAAQLGLMVAFEAGTQIDIARKEQALHQMECLLAILVRVERGKRPACCAMM